MNKEINYRVARTETDFGHGKSLFREYAASLGVDLSFQDFENELALIDRQYHTPHGALLLAFDEEAAVGCAGVRRIDAQMAELKRMYVQDAYRGYRIGVHLLERSIQVAKQLGYEKMRLDTLKNMTRAQELYRSFGFYEIPAYRFNPLEGTMYMEKEL